TLAVAATYRTSNATPVSFEVDGQAPGAQAGLDTSGPANLPDAPWDGKSHQITVVADHAAGQSVQATPSVKRHAVPVIASVPVARSVHCDSTDTQVAVAWQSSGAKSAEVTLDGGVSAKDLPASGSTTVDVPCSDGTQKIGLVVTAGDGQQASVVHSIRT